MSLLPPSNPDDEAREVVERMALLRCEIVDDVEHVAVSAKAMAETAKAMTDWTFYVRRFPWAAVGAAAVVGFLLVPRKKTAITPTREQLAELAKSKEFVAAATEQLKPPRSVLAGVGATLAAMAGRAALSYVTEQLREKAAQSREQLRPTAPAGNGRHDSDY